MVKKSCESLLLCVAADSEYIIDSVLSYTILVQDLVSRSKFLLHSINNSIK